MAHVALWNPVAPLNPGLRPPPSSQLQFLLYSGLSAVPQVGPGCVGPQNTFPPPVSLIPVVFYILMDAIY